MNETNIHTFLISLNLCIFCVIILSKRSSCADYRYEACTPSNCGNGPNISFPFYISGQRESYCGYPRFNLICNHNGFPVLNLRGDDFVVEDIFYQTKSLRVSDPAFSSLNSSAGCVPRITVNTTLPGLRYEFVGNVTTLHLFSNCTNSSLSEGRLRYCNAEDRNDWVLPLYENSENFTNALESCGRNVVVPVEEHVEDENLGRGSVVEVLRRGFVLNWTVNDCSECTSSGGRCGFNETTYHFWCFCPDRPHALSCKSHKKWSMLMLAIAISGSLILILLCLSISFIIWQRKKRIKSAFHISRAKSNVDGGSFYFGIPVFSYTELEKATNSFDSSKELGDGGFGTVYYGKLPDGREVAIKRLYEHNYKRVQQFMNEIKILTCLRHRNLVSLYGCTSRSSRELLLVYEYIPNGTVAEHLHGEGSNGSPITWAHRMNIAIETATALAYLHKSDIIHRDVKTNNILLDNNFVVKVADFGLSRLCPNDVSHVSTAPQGTPGYVDPEYHQCYQLTDKSDVYSFGVVLIELISSMPAVDISRHRHEINLANLALNRIQRCAFDELIDPSLGYKSDPDVARMTTSVAELAFRCLQLEKDMRPSMDEVLEILKDIQNCEGFKFDEKIKEANDNDNYSVHGKSICSPETDDAVLLSGKKFQPSPNAVTDVWISSSSITSSVG
ncbi:hypothetical protein BUALT_Bualt05G0122800 [Buddleja alternifolia]|uniref:non-specific serine/threonine protein kinase n=1 Tax=Buddleja alternifolia TaxID=168488 RepID=A0AAV6XIK3_9LAMI|nr:hypothetical protein BUALT_Bualt05G0122800 [Buddleja alternifolia]